jgi:hypothetical protein
MRETDKRMSQPESSPARCNSRFDRAAMIYIASPGDLREILIDVLECMSVDFTEDPTAAKISISKLNSASREFNYSQLRKLMESKESFRAISRKMSLTPGTLWRYMRKIPLSEIPEEHQEFFSSYRCLVDARKEIERLIRGVGNEFGQRRMHRMLDKQSQVSAGHLY